VVMEKRSLTLKKPQVVEKQFKLIEDEFSREMCAHHPKVQILRGVNLIILEGPDEEVQLAETKLEDPIKQLKEKRVQLSAALMIFMTSSGVISKYQTRFQRSLRSPVALEIGSDLVLSSLSSAALVEAETAVLRDLSELTVQLQGSIASSPHLDQVKEILIKATNEANLQELRVEVSFVPDPRAAVINVQLVGYTEHVNKLKDALQEYQ
ncbi:protein mono-ADP-ribosyltransferase PARP14-like, partial [Scomber scombrus]